MAWKVQVSQKFQKYLITGAKIVIEPGMEIVSPVEEPAIEIHGVFGWYRIIRGKHRSA